MRWENLSDEEKTVKTIEYYEKLDPEMKVILDSITSELEKFKHEIEKINGSGTGDIG